MKRRLTSAIYQGLAVSLALHFALALPLVLHKRSLPREEPTTLVIDVVGVVADSQTDEKILQERKGEAKPEGERTEKPAETPPDPTPETAQATERPVDVAAEAPPPPPEPTRAPAPAEETSPAVTETKVGPAGVRDGTGGAEQQDARTIKAERDVETDRLRDYAKQLTKKIQAHLVYPEDARQAGLVGTATVSFTVLPGGQIQAGSLRISVGSGQPKLDASALNTARASVPFDPPPQEMTVGIAVEFGGKCIGPRSCMAR